ncbi:hypothetical protein MNBD_GAMMA18-950 [hydrothermal vent metagenome]|uniref:N-acetyltransferase domain-containing protein n=1 Tax=hydrothermal vent metagenome TaxID=652676 RepID=A0A3B0Z0T9_9ZZZZ
MLKFRFSNGQNIGLIVDLVNEAYRGHNSSPGWTHEADLLAGARITCEQLAAQLALEETQMLLAEKDNKLVGCMMLSQNNGKICIGTFAVSPKIQANGIGRQMLLEAEKWASQRGSKEIAMVVITQRKDLIAYYQRRGYVVSGEVADFPLHLNVGTPQVDNLSITGLAKQL